MKFNIVISIVICSVFLFYSFGISACEIKISDLVKNSQDSEKFNQFTFLVKSGEKWFYLSQDNDCWIKVRYVNNLNNQKTLNHN